MTDEASKETERTGFLGRLRQGLARTRVGFAQKVEHLVAGRVRVDEELLEELEEVLIGADVGVPTAVALVDKLRGRVREERLRDATAVQAALQEEITALLQEAAAPLALNPDGLTAITVVGVNGAGKTTTIAKLAHRLQAEGKSVLLGAGDTFRAAAIEQLETWAQRIDVPVIAQREGSDPAAVAYDAIQAARARKVDIVIVDTAGRLQTKTNLMQELAKVHRVMERELQRPLDETLLVLDATTGQNALSQGKLFGEAVSVSGLVLTKLDGTSKGGIAIALAQELNLPVKLIGIGEGLDDLKDFEPAAFAAALVGSDGADG